MAVVACVPHHLVWQACVRFSWVTWAPRCLQGSLSTRTCFSFFLFLFLNFYWRIVALQCCVSF